MTFSWQDHNKVNNFVMCLAFFIDGETKMLKIKGKYLFKDNKRFFYLADTCWSAFTSIQLSDWRYYLDARQAEGVNVIQINVLRQWDSSQPIREPFAVRNSANGMYQYDFRKVNESYFANAEKMLEEMSYRGMIPVLVLLWGNYVPDTWMSKYIKNNTIPFDLIESYVTYVVNRFKRFNPIWCISGDVGFTDNGKQKPNAAVKYYREVLNTAKKADPAGLFTFHINGESHDLPKEFVDQIDFYCYQSGHGYYGQTSAYEIPLILRNKERYEGPIIDAELCYEGLTKMKAPEPERYCARDVRCAAWRAVLSGADAGIGYGAFGIWPWNDTAKPEQKLESNFNVQLTPYDWRDCLKFSGAKDMGFLKTIVMQLAESGLSPIEVPVKNNPTIRAAQNDQYLLIYLPSPTKLDFTSFGLTVSTCQVIDLQKRYFLTGKVLNNVLQLLPVAEDEVVVVKK